MRGSLGAAAFYDDALCGVLGQIKNADNNCGVLDLLRIMNQNFREIQAHAIACCFTTKNHHYETYVFVSGPQGRSHVFRVIAVSR